MFYLLCIVFLSKSCSPISATLAFLMLNPFWSYLLHDHVVANGCVACEKSFRGTMPYSSAFALNACPLGSFRLPPTSPTQIRV